MSSETCVQMSTQIGASLGITCDGNPEICVIKLRLSVYYLIN